MLNLPFSSPISANPFSKLVRYKGNSSSIKLKFDSYGKYKNYSKKYFSIELEYDEFGEIKELENPIKE